MKLTSSIKLVAYIHGNAQFADHVRRLCATTHYDCIAVDLPAAFEEELPRAVDELPYVSAVLASATADPVYYVPTDPCDASIEAIRQARQNRLPCVFVGFPVLEPPVPLPPLPDAYAAQTLGFDAFSSLALLAVGNPPPGSQQDLAGQYLAHRLRALQTRYSNVLALVHVRHYSRTVYHFGREESYNRVFTDAPAYAVTSRTINPDHLYFALGELPFIAGKLEKDRFDPFSGGIDILDCVKRLFTETRDDYFEQQESVAGLSPARIQIALTFVRNLTVMSGAFLPSLFDIVEAAKGVGGNAFALRILRNAKYYPYLPVEQSGSFLSVGIDRIAFPEDRSVHDAINLFRDTTLVWRALSIKPDPPDVRKYAYRYRWNPNGMCSHIPEDEYVESFNAHVRTKALRVLTEDLVKSEKFTSSVKDGIDFRETLRNWHTGHVYVKELPPSRGALDTVVIIFDEDHDERYPHCATWYAEHVEESTLTFYATDPFQDMLGPGIARSYYGGLSLLFPPRPVPNVFDLTDDSRLSLAARLTFGALQFSGERNVAYVAARRPGQKLRSMARELKKHLVWVPMSSFGTETIRKLRRFHVLNGKQVRSWAARFIGN